MERFDEEVEKALIKGFDVNEYLLGLTKEHPSVAGEPMERVLENWDARIAAARESRAIEHVGAVAQERKAYELVQQAEAHLKRCMDHWEAACTRVHETSPEN